MAKFCNYVVCGSKLLTIQQGALMCISDAKTEELMPSCVDFDAVLDDRGGVHIVATDEAGDLIYIRNVSDRWGKGIVGRKIKAENIFVFYRNRKTEIFYAQDGNLVKQAVGDEVYSAEVIAELWTSTIFFADTDDVYYVNSKGKLCCGKGEIHTSGEVDFVFSAGGYFCFKDREGLKYAEALNPDSLTNLTKKHGKTAKCPIITESALYWIDGSYLFYAPKKEGVWQRLERANIEDFDSLGIYKFCTEAMVKYEIGYQKSGTVCRWEDAEKPQDDAESQRSDRVRNLKKEFDDFFRMEQILGEIREIHRRIAEIDKKIECFKELKTRTVVTNIPKSIKRKDLSKMHKKD